MTEQGETTEAGEGVEEGSEAFLAHFTFVLPDVLSVNNGVCFTQIITDLPEPTLAGVAVPVLQDARSDGTVSIDMPDEGACNFVTLMVHQVRRSPDETQAQRHLRAMREVYVKTFTAPSGDIGKGKALLPPDYTTVVEAVTYVPTERDFAATQTHTDALTRSVDALMRWHRGFRVQGRIPIPELTYERIDPSVFHWRRPWTGGTAGQPSFKGLLLLSHTNIPVSHVVDFDDEVADRMTTFTLRHNFADPLITYREKRLDAEIELHRNGRRTESLIQCAIASEVLLNAVLSLMLWEESERSLLSDEDAAFILSDDVTPRLKRQYDQRLDGKWVLTHEPLKSWRSSIWFPRGRALHGGYNVPEHEAVTALEVLDRLEKALGDSLAMSLSKYPRTAWLYLGERGFSRRSKSRMRKAREWLDQQVDDADQYAWLDRHAAWRGRVDPLVERRQASV